MFLLNDRINISERAQQLVMEAEPTTHMLDD